MVSTESIQVVLNAQDNLSQKVRQATNEIRNMGSASNSASSIASAATNRIGNAYDMLRSRVQSVWTSIGNTIRNNSIVRGITSSSLAQPFLNAAESIKQRWSSMVETIKSKLRGMTSSANVGGGFNISNAGLATLNGQITTTTGKVTLLSRTLVALGSIGGGIGTRLGAAFLSASAKVDSFKAKLQNAGTRISNIAGGLSGLQGVMMSAFGAVGVTSIRQFTIEAAIAREKVNAVTKSVTGSGQAFQKVNAQIKAAAAGTTLGYNNLATAVNNVALRFNVTGEAVGNLAGPMSKIGVLAQAMGKSTSEAASLMEHAFDGLQGKWRSLKQFNITEDDLKKAGWSGAANDVVGYANALDKVLEKKPELKEFTSTFEYQFESFKMSVRGVGTEIGLMLLPMLKDLVSGLNDLAKNHPEILKIVIIIGLLVLALSSIAMVIMPIIQLAQAIQLVTVATAIWNAVMALNPITWVVIAIAALIAILIYLYYTNEDVRNALNGLWEFLSGTFIGAWEWLNTTLTNLWNFLSSTFIAGWNWLWTTLLGIYEWLVGTFGGAWQWICDAFTNASLAINSLISWLQWLYMKFVEVLPLIMTILMPWTLLFNQQFQQTAIGAVQAFILWISQLPGKLWTWLWNAILKVMAWAQDMKNRFKKAASDAVSNFIKFIETLPERTWYWLLRTIEKIKQWAIDLYYKMREAGRKAVEEFKAKFDIPTIVKQKLDETRRSIENMAGRLVQAMRNMAKRMWDAFWAQFGGNAAFEKTIGPQVSSMEKALNFEVAGAEHKFVHSNESTSLKDITKLLQELVDNDEVLIDEQSNATSSPSGMELVQSGTITIVHDVNLSGVPAGMDEEALRALIREVFTSRDFIRELASNRDFQSLDKRIKQRILGEYGRHI